MPTFIFSPPYLGELAHDGCVADASVLGPKRDARLGNLWRTERERARDDNTWRFRTNGVCGGDKREKLHAAFDGRADVHIKRLRIFSQLTRGENAYTPENAPCCGPTPWSAFQKKR